MAALDRLDDLERFLLAMQATDAFRPHPLWRLPLLGSHEYRLPDTIDERLGGVHALAEALAHSPIELVVCATDVTDTTGGDDPGDYELVYSSRSTEPDEMAQAILASGAISTLVMPVRVGDRIATDGGWLRNYPLAHAYHRPGVELIVAFRYFPRYTPFDATPLATIRRRLGRFGRVPPVRALIEELKVAEAREARGEPAHLLDMITRLMRIAVLRASVLRSGPRTRRTPGIEALARLREEVDDAIRRGVSDPHERERVAAAVAEPLRRRALPLRPRPARAPHHRPRLGAGREPRAAVAHAGAWSDEDKRALIERGWELTDEALAAAGVDQPTNVAQSR